MLGAHRLIFTLVSNFELDSEMLVLHSGPKFMCLVSSTILQVLLILVPNRNCIWKSFALICPVLEITSLNWTFSFFGLGVDLVYSSKFSWIQLNLYCFVFVLKRVNSQMLTIFSSIEFMMFVLVVRQFPSLSHICLDNSEPKNTK